MIEEYSDVDQKIIDEINALSAYQICKHWRCCKAGHIYFDRTKPYWAVFQARFKKLGGMTPEMSKAIGW